MNKKGDTDVRNPLPQVGIAILVLGIVVLGAGYLLYGGGIEKVKTLLPNLGFGEKTKTTSSILRYDISSEILQFYDGNGWVEITSPEFELDKKKIKYLETKASFESYYFTNDLEPEYVKLPSNLGGEIYQTFPSYFEFGEQPQQLSTQYCIRLKQKEEQGTYSIKVRTDSNQVDILFNDISTGLYLQKIAGNNNERIIYFQETPGVILGKALIGGTIEFDSFTDARMEKISGHISSLNRKHYQDLIDKKIQGGVTSGGGVEVRENSVVIELLQVISNECSNSVFGVFTLTPDQRLFFTPIDIERYKNSQELKLSTAEEKEVSNEWPELKREIQNQIENWKNTVLKIPINLKYTQVGEKSEFFCIERRDIVYLAVNLNDPKTPSYDCTNYGIQ